MKYIAVTLPGIEDVLIKEIKEILGSNAKKIKKGRVMFETKDIDKFVYMSRSMIKVYEFVHKFKFQTLKQIEEEVEKLDFKFEQPFVARCVRKTDLSFATREIEEAVGAIIFKKGFKVNLKKPKTTVLVELLDDVCIIGYLKYDDLHKRDYRIRFHRQSINACLAYAMVRLANWDKKKILLDPFVKDGVIVIEAAQYAKQVPRGHFEKILSFPGLDKKIRDVKSNIYGYDNLLSDIRNTEINMKLAGIRKEINLSKTSIDWLDIKFKEESIDCIVTNPPFPSPSNPEKKVKHLYEDLFRQAEMILKKKGRIIMVSPKKELLLYYSKQFKKVEERVIKIGGQAYFLIIWTK
ncbi:MAG: THUMP domain-containing protein [archaeon]